MFIRSLCTTLCAVVLAVVPMSGAFAAEPIPGVDVIVRKNPGGIMVGQTTTDAKGEFTLKELPPGSFRVEIDGKSLVAATAGKRTTGPGTPPGDGPPIIAVLVGLLLPAVQSRGAAPTPQTFHGKATARGMQIDLVVPDGPAKSYKGTLTY